MNKKLNSQCHTSTCEFSSEEVFFNKEKFYQEEKNNKERYVFIIFWSAILVGHIIREL